MQLEKLTSQPRNCRIKLLLKGAPGTGKTWIAGHFPKPAIIDFEDNTRCYFKDTFPQDLAKDIVIVNPRREGGVSTGKELAPILWWKNACSLIDSLAEEPSIETIVLDSLTAITNLIFYSTTKTFDPSHRITQPEFGDFHRQINSLGTLFLEEKTITKNIVVIAHEVEKTDEDGKNPQLVLNMPTSQKATFPKYFTDVWRTFVRVQLTGGPKYLVRTEPMPNGPGKCSLNIPAEFEWTTQYKNILSQISGSSEPEQVTNK